MKKKPIWNKEGPEACKQIYRSSYCGFIYSGFKCGNCGKHVEIRIRTLDANHPMKKPGYVFVAIETSKTEMLVRRHNGVTEYFFFMCDDCCKKEIKENGSDDSWEDK